MNENKKQALKMFLEYIFEENGKTTEIETIVETYVLYFFWVVRFLCVL